MIGLGSVLGKKKVVVFEEEVWFCSSTAFFMDAFANSPIPSSPL
jgi:hypothetical protein